MADPNKTYMLPPALMTALMTNRSEFVTLYITQLKSGKEVLSVEGQVSLLDLIVDLISDREESRTEAERLRQRLAATISNINGSLEALRHALEEAKQ